MNSDQGERLVAFLYFELPLLEVFSLFFSSPPEAAVLATAPEVDEPLPPLPPPPLEEAILSTYSPIISFTRPHECSGMVIDERVVLFTYRKKREKIVRRKRSGSGERVPQKYA